MAWGKTGNIRGPAGLSSALLGGGSAATPASLGLGAVTTVAVPITWAPNAPADGNYLATANIVGTGGLLGALAVQGITAKTATTVTVSVKATGLLPGTGTVDVTCLKVGT